MSKSSGNGNGNGNGNGYALAIVPISPEQFPVLANASELADVMRQNFGGEGISPSDLTRIKVPSGGAITWEVDGEEPTKVLEGIIVHIARRRAYWSNPSPTGDPPDCTSADCLVGIGNPGGPCEVCQFNEWESAIKQDGSQGRGKACTEAKLVFLIRTGQTLPDVVTVPPGSLKLFKAYQTQLTKRGLAYCSVITRLELEKTKNKDGIAFAQIKASVVGKLDKEAADGIRAYAQQLGSLFMAATIVQTEVAGEPVEV